MGDLMGENISLLFDKKVYKLPVLVGTHQEKGLDIRKLRQDTGYITLDSGFGNTGACESSITYIDGEAGILHYRGIPIEILAEKSNFLETAYLLIYGNLPTFSQQRTFIESLKREVSVDQSIIDMISCYSTSSHPMAALASMVCSLSGCYQDSLSPKDPEQIEKSIHRLLSVFPIIVAYIYRRFNNKTLIDSDISLDYSENILNMMFGNPDQYDPVDPDFAEILDMLLILHADHEQNCSTSTLRCVGSSGSNLFASVASAICALWGPKHGGANQSVIEMLQKILDEGIAIENVIQLSKDKNSSFRLMGFGHRVYKNYDPRATVIKAACDQLLQKGYNDPLLDIAQKLEVAALEDSYFQDHRLYPNVDFYSGVIYRAMKIPVNMFTVMFALGRLPGWIAHWKEMNQNDDRIVRPRQIYIGPQKNEYTPISQREELI